MRYGNQLAAAVLAEVHNPSVVGTGQCLSEFDVLAFGFIEQAQGRIDERGSEAFFLDSGQALFGIDCAERGVGAVTAKILPRLFAPRPHAAQSRQPRAIENLGELATNFEWFFAAIVVAELHRTGLVSCLDIPVPQGGVFENVSIGIDGPWVFELAKLFRLCRHNDSS